MKLPLGTRFTILIVSVLALAIFSTATSVVSSWRIRKIMADALHHTSASVRSAEELQISLLEQRGLVSAYMLDDGNRKWLVRLTERISDFRQELSKTRSLAQTPEEHQILDELGDVFTRYDNERRRAVSLFQDGKLDEAKQVLLYEVHELYERAHGLCEAFISINESLVEEAIAKASDDAQQATIFVMGLVVVTIAMNGVRSPAPLAAVLASSNKPQEERCSWTKSVTSRSPSRQRSCDCCKRRNSSAWEVAKLFARICASWPPPTATWKWPCRTAASVKIFTTA